MQKKPTDSELEILQLLWQHGPSSVRDVHTALSGSRPVVYTTTLKTMQVMAEKGFLERDTSRRTHLYSAVVKEEHIQANLLDKFVNTVFRGSPLKLAVRALGHRQAKQGDLEELKKIIEELENKKQ